MDDVIILISQSYAKDIYGVDRPVQTTRDVFCRVNSVSRQEFFDGGRNGLNPEYVFTLFAGEYSGESVCRYRGNQYAVYRTYHVTGTDYLELYVQREGGTNGQENNA